MSTPALRGLGVMLLASLALLPLLPVLAAVVPSLAALTSALEPWFAFQCQREPGRVLQLAGTPLAVCARCSGIYFGVGLGALVRRPRLNAGQFRGWLLTAALLMLADVALERGGAHGAWAAARLATGLALGYPLGSGLGALLTRAPASSV